MTIKGYLFDTQQQCQDAIDLINQSLGLPDEHHTSHSQPSQNDGKWFIVQDEHTVPIFGEGIEFELIPEPKLESR